VCAAFSPALTLSRSYSGRRLAASSTCSVPVRCSECDAGFELSARREYEHRKAGKRPVCRDCRSHRAPIVVTESLRRWWLDRYTLDEIRELAEGAFGL
jgi:hypothetical protein